MKVHISCMACYIYIYTIFISKFKKYNIILKFKTSTYKCSGYKNNKITQSTKITSFGIHGTSYHNKFYNNSTFCYLSYDAR